LKSGSLNLLEPSGLVQDCTGINSTFPISFSLPILLPLVLGPYIYYCYTVQLPAVDISNTINILYGKCCTRMTQNSGAGLNLSKGTLKVERVLES
jgi:hypothetical protein